MLAALLCDHLLRLGAQAESSLISIVQPIRRIQKLGADGIQVVLHFLEPGSQADRRHQSPLLPSASGVRSDRSGWRLKKSATHCLLGLLSGLLVTAPRASRMALTVSFISDLVRPNPCLAVSFSHDNKRSSSAAWSSVLGCAFMGRLPLTLSPKVA